jgi:hypothetical protein
MHHNVSSLRGAVTLLIACGLLLSNTLARPTEGSAAGRAGAGMFAPASAELPLLRRLGRLDSGVNLVPASFSITEPLDQGPKARLGYG